MGFFGGLKKIGKGIGRGVKKIGRGIDKFDDLIKLKELAQIGQFIPGVNVIAKPLSMVYSGYDVAKGLKNKDLLGAGMAGLQFMGSKGIKTGGGIGNITGGTAGFKPWEVDALSSKLGGFATSPKPGFGSQIMSNISSFGKSAYSPIQKAMPFAKSAYSKYKDLDPMTQDLIKGIGGGVGAAMLSRNAQQSQQGGGGGYMPYAPMSYGSLGMQGMAHGGISGDWHEPINMLPPNYEGWVDKPSIATLGESGSEAVLPLNKLVPAMRQGGLNYSPGQAIVGEAGPEYITGLRPGQEDWARSILNVPAMQTGGVVTPLTGQAEIDYRNYMRERDADTSDASFNLRNYADTSEVADIVSTIQNPVVSSSYDEKIRKMPLEFQKRIAQGLATQDPEIIRSMGISLEEFKKILGYDPLLLSEVDVGNIPSNIKAIQASPSGYSNRLDYVGTPGIAADDPNLEMAKAFSSRQPASDKTIAGLDALRSDEIGDQERFLALSHNISDRVPVDTMGRTSAQGGILDSSAPIILDSPDPDKIPDDEVEQVVEDITGKEDIRQDPIEEAMAIEQANAQERAIEEWSKGLGKTKGDKEVPEGMPSWLSPVLSGLGAYAGYKRGGGGLKGILSGALGGILGQYGGEALKGSPKIGEWVRENPAKSALLAYPLLGEILGERGKQPTNYYQGYNPTSYGSMGMPGLQEGGVAGAADSTLSLLERLMQGGVHPAVKEERAKGIPLWARAYASRRNPTVPRPNPMNNILEALERARPSYPSPGTPLPEMQAGGISGLDSLRTGLRDAIVNSIDDPNRQSVNSFVPAMLKAYDEIPKLAAGGIATGANPGFIDPGKQAIQQKQSQPGYAQSKAGDYGQGMTYGTDPRLKKMNQGLGSALGGVPGIGHIGRGMGAVARQVAAPAIQQVQANPAGVVPGAGTGAGQPVSDAMNLIGPGPGTTGQPVQNAFGNLGSGLASQIGQNIMEQRAAMGGLGSNMTEQQLAQGMMGGLAGLQGQEFGQRMGMAQFDQRERENMARYGLLGDQAANRPGYMSNIMRSIYA